MECKNTKCNKSLEPNRADYCSIDCAREKFVKRLPKERTCSKCGKIEFVQNSLQQKMNCRSCSKLGNNYSTNMSEEARKRISEARKSRDPWNKGKSGIYSSDTKRKMGEKNKGKKLDKSHRSKIASGLKKFYLENDGPNKGKVMSEDQRNKISESLNCNTERLKFDGKLLKECIKNLGLVLFNQVENGTYFRVHDRIDLKCSNCDSKYSAPIYTIEAGNAKLCLICSKKISTPQREVAQMVQKLGIPEDQILQNIRPDFMNGLELDIYIPSKNVAIEYHGLAHHSERPIFGPKDLRKIKKQHQEKYQLCRKAGVKLIQIFEDEWRDKQALLVSMIENRLGLTRNKVGARKGEIRPIKAPEQRAFFDANHISGYTAGKIGYGLFIDGELMAAINFRKPFQKNIDKGVYEIARFAVKAGWNVQGAFPRLMNAFAQSDIEVKRLITFADCRFGTGEVYEMWGFRHLRTTEPNYFYESGGIRKTRLAGKKSNEADMLALGSTEREQQNTLDWYALYDAGNEVYEYLVE